MIRNKKELKEYMEADRIALGRKHCKPQFGDLIWKYEIALRMNEYFKNCEVSVFEKPKQLFYKFQFKILGILLGYELPLNCIGKGLSIAHQGPIIINGGATIGDNCRIHVGVNIGTVPGCTNVAPHIGDNVYIAPGVKIYGRIDIASGIIIGANSVVNKSFTEENICIAGIPARKISDKGRFEVEERNKQLFSNTP
jgi:serine O-acetyltransferase